MESPINPGVFRFIFNVALGSLSAATIFSIYHQKYDMHASLNDTFSKIKRAETEEEQEALLREVLGRLQTDAIKKDASARLSALKHGSTIVKFLKLEKDGSNATSFLAAVKVALRVFGADAPGHRRFQQLGGYKALLVSLSIAYRLGLQDAMEEAAEALRVLSQVNDADVVLDSDVPEGAEGAYALAMAPSTTKMLSIMDPEGSTLFLSAVTGIFANICTLKAGAVEVGRGCDGHSGMSYFLKLLEHTNRSVIENSVMAIRFMARAGVCQEELCTEDSISKLSENLHVKSEPTVINSILTVVLCMAGSDKYKKPFFTNLASSSIPTTLFDLWVRSPDKAIRNRAEILCRLLGRIDATAPTTAALLERYRGPIQERKQKDEQEHQQQMQQMQQNAFMQRMMMEQMGMDPSMMGA